MLVPELLRLLLALCSANPALAGRVAGLPGLGVSDDVRAVVEELLLAHLPPGE